MIQSMLDVVVFNLSSISWTFVSLVVLGLFGFAYIFRDVWIDPLPLPPMPPPGSMDPSIPLAYLMEIQRQQQEKTTLDFQSDPFLSTLLYPTMTMFPGIASMIGLPANHVPALPPTGVPHINNNFMNPYSHYPSYAMQQQQQQLNTVKPSLPTSYNNQVSNRIVPQPPKLWWQTSKPEPVPTGPSQSSSSTSSWFHRMTRNAPPPSSVVPVVQVKQQQQQPESPPPPVACDVVDVHQQPLNQNMWNEICEQVSATNASDDSDESSSSSSSKFDVFGSEDEDSDVSDDDDF